MLLPTRNESHRSSSDMGVKCSGCLNAHKNDHRFTMMAPVSSDTPGNTATSAGRTDALAPCDGCHVTAPQTVRQPRTSSSKSGTRCRPTPAWTSLPLMRWLLSISRSASSCHRSSTVGTLSPKHANQVHTYNFSRLFLVLTIINLGAHESLACGVRLPFLPELLNELAPAERVGWELEIGAVDGGYLPLRAHTRR